MAGSSLVSLTSNSSADDWLQFRGTRGDSVARNSDPPTEWTAEEVDWKVALPGRGVGGAIVVGDQVITTSSEGTPKDRLHVFSIDVESGEIRWKRSLWATGRTNCHPLTAMSAPTPASDGKQIYALFGSNDLICLDLEGNVQWIRALSKDNQYAFDDRGLASSPWVIGNRLIIQIECQGDSFAAGIDTATGETKWQVPLAKTTCWSTPLSVTYEGAEHALIQTADRVMVVQPELGKIAWEFETPSGQIPSPTVEGKRVFIPSRGMIAIDIPSQGAETSPAWTENRLGPQRSCAIVNDDQLLVIRSQILTSGAVEDGQVGWRLRLEGAGFWASPVLAGGRVYAVSSDGIVFVVDPSGEEGEIVAQNEMNEEMLGSPAVAGNAIYLRGVEHLYKVSR